MDVYLLILQAQKLQEKQHAQAKVDQAELRRFVQVVICYNPVLSRYVILCTTVLAGKDWNVLNLQQKPTELFQCICTKHQHVMYFVC